MTQEVRTEGRHPVAALMFVLLASGALAHAQGLFTPPGVQALPNMGQQITPLAPRDSRFEPLNPDLPDDPAWLAGQAVTTVVSPDQKTLLILTSGYNRVYNTSPTPPFPWNGPDSKEYVFVYDISSRTPIKKQVVQIPNTYNGIVFDPSGQHFYVAGGENDNVHTITLTNGMWAEEQPVKPALTMGHILGIGLNLKPNGAIAINKQLGVYPCAAGVAISKDGQTLVVANYYNDSITIFKGGYGNWSRAAEVDLRPGKSDPSKAGVPGGEYPFWVAVKGTGTAATAYVSSLRDREVDVVSLYGSPALFGPQGVPTITTRIPVRGQPNKMTLNAAQTLLYVVEDQSDTVDVIDTATNSIVETIPVIASLLPGSLDRYKGANPNSAALSPDEKQLYVTDGNLNCVAVVALGGTNSGDHVAGLIPTGWYPNSVSISGDGAMLYVVNGKSPTGSNPGWCYGGYGPPGSPNCYLSNQYNPDLLKAGFQSLPLPGPDQLTTLTAQVVSNNRFSSTESAADAAVMAAVRQGVQHVIFIVKENRTYDQILGDLEIGNGDPDLTEFGQSVTPNQHSLARTFVTLDNFMDTAEVSYDGWLWTTSAQAPDVVEKQWPLAYAYRGLSMDSEGLNRNVNVSIPTVAGRQAANPFTSSDPDVLPGQTNVAAPDGPDNEINTGYLWNSALRAHLSVRNYGFFVDTTRYTDPATTDFAVPLLRDPYSTGTTVAFPTNASLAAFTDPYFRGFDNSLPDFYRYREWERDFDANYAKGGLPALSLVRFMHDHTGNYSLAIDGVNTPELEVADNDYAVGLLIQKIANSIYADNTLIFVIEDDAQDGGDHMDSHRSIAFVAGACVKRRALVSTQYNTINFLRTIEEVLGLSPMNLNDALARPMADIFTTTPAPWNFTATPAPMLYAPNTTLPLPLNRRRPVVPKPTHNAGYWARATRGMDFKDADEVDPGRFNHVLWKGLMGRKPYPAATGKDLRANRQELLAHYRVASKEKPAGAPKRGSN